MALGGVGNGYLRHVVKLMESGTNQFVVLYDDDVPLWEKAKTVATHLYGPTISSRIRGCANSSRNFKRKAMVVSWSAWLRLNTVCPPIQASRMHLYGVHSAHPRDPAVDGAEFLVVVCGEILTMPGVSPGACCE